MHIVETGAVELRVDGGARVERVGRGDVVLVPRGDLHHLCDIGACAPEVRWLCGTFAIGTGLLRDTSRDALADSGRIPPIYATSTHRCIRLARITIITLDRP
ncbi:hypothetical protein [Nocardia sp. alder85J]|uniref:hypothetical protein n=1 Tax=Nocardia sp. alder85J TaxID=2862949 RepID=UPI003A4E6787